MHFILSNNNIRLWNLDFGICWGLILWLTPVVASGGKNSQPFFCNDGFHTGFNHKVIDEKAHNRP